MILMILGEEVRRRSFVSRPSSPTHGSKVDQCICVSHCNWPGDFVLAPHCRSQRCPHRASHCRPHQHSALHTPARTPGPRGAGCLDCPRSRLSRRGELQRQLGHGCWRKGGRHSPFSVGRRAQSRSGGLANVRHRHPPARGAPAAPAPHCLAEPGATCRVCSSEVHSVSSSTSCLAPHHHPSALPLFSLSLAARLPLLCPLPPLVRGRQCTLPDPGPLGIGIGDSGLVEGVRADSQAARAGVRVGWTITSVGGTEVQGLPTSSIISLLGGAPRPVTCTFSCPQSLEQPAAFAAARSTV